MTSTATRQHRCNTSVPCFERFQTNNPSVFQSIQSIAPIDISCPVNNQGFCKQLSSYTKVALFCSKPWAGMSPFLVALSILWVAALKSLQLKENAVEWMKANPTRSAIVWVDLETLTLTFPNLAVHICTWMNLPNFARYSGKCQMLINVIRAR